MAAPSWDARQTFAQVPPQGMQGHPQQQQQQQQQQPPVRPPLAQPDHQRQSTSGHQHSRSSSFFSAFRSKPSNGHLQQHSQQQGKPGGWDEPARPNNGYAAGAQLAPTQSNQAVPSPPQKPQMMQAHPHPQQNPMPQGQQQPPVQRRASLSAAVIPTSSNGALHPEIKSVVTLALIHAHKVYFSGPLVRRVERNPDGHRPKEDEGWVDVWAQLGGTTLSIWDMKAIEEASKRGEEVPPTYVNVTDAFIQVLGSITTPATQNSPPKKYTNVLTLNTAGSNLLLFSCPSAQSLVSWAAALRLSAWEKSRLEEIYTSHLLRMSLSPGGQWHEPHTTLTKGRMEGWVKVRVAGQVDWKRLWMSISAPANQVPDSPDARRNRLSSIFSSGRSSPPPAGAGTRPMVQLFGGNKPKDRKRAWLTITNVTQAFAVYPERPELINRSTLFKVEGHLGDEDFAGGMRGREAWLLIMPEAEQPKPESVEMLRWIVAFHDAFQLYGRPRGYTWDPRDPTSMMFTYPVGPHRDHLFLDRELAETLDPRDDRTPVIRSRLINILIERMRPDPQRNGPPQQRDTLPQLPPIEFRDRQANVSSRLTTITERSVTHSTDMHNPNEPSSAVAPNGTQQSLPPLPEDGTPRGTASSPAQSDQRDAQLSQPATFVSPNQNQDLVQSPIASESLPPQAAVQRTDYFSQSVSEPSQAKPTPTGNASLPTSPGSSVDPADIRLPPSTVHSPIPRASPATVNPGPTPLQPQREGSPASTASRPGANRGMSAQVLSPSRLNQSPILATDASDSTPSAAPRNVPATSPGFSGAPMPYSASPPPRKSESPGPRPLPQREQSTSALRYETPTQPVAPAPAPAPVVPERKPSPPPLTIRTTSLSPPPRHPLHVVPKPESPKPQPQVVTVPAQPPQPSEYIFDEAGALFVMQNLDEQPTLPRRQAAPPEPSSPYKDSDEDEPPVKAVQRRQTPMSFDQKPVIPPSPQGPTHQEVPPAQVAPGQVSPPSRLAAQISPSPPPPRKSSEGPALNPAQLSHGVRASLGRKPSGARALPNRRVFPSEASTSKLTSVADAESPEDMKRSVPPPAHAPAHPNPDGQDESYADVLAALTFADRADSPPSQQQRKQTLPSEGRLPPLPPIPSEHAPPVSSPSNDASHAYPSSFAPSHKAAERKAKAQAQQAASQAAAMKPGRPNGRKTKAKDQGAWGESSEEEEEEEEEEEDDDDGSDGAPANPRTGAPSIAAPQPRVQGRMPSGQHGEPGMGGVAQHRPSPDGTQPRGTRMLPQIPGAPANRGSQYDDGRPRSQYDDSTQTTQQLQQQQQIRQHHDRSPSSHLPQRPVWSSVLDPQAASNANAASARDTFVQLEPSEAITKAFTPQGLLQAGMQDKADRSAKRQEELARESGASLINVPAKPPPPQTGLVGAISGYERDRKREGGVGAALTERERERRIAEERQRKIDELQRQQLDHLSQVGHDQFGGQQPGMMPYNPMMPQFTGYGPMMGYNPMMGMMPQYTGYPGAGWPGVNPQQMWAAQQAAAQAYQAAMMTFSQAGSVAPSEAGGNDAPRPSASPAPGMGMNPMWGGMGGMGGMGMMPGMMPMGGPGYGMGQTPDTNTPARISPMGSYQNSPITGPSRPTDTLEDPRRPGGNSIGNSPKPGPIA